MNVERYNRLLMDAKRQEDVDKIVHAACKDVEITPCQLGELMKSVKARRAQLPERGEKVVTAWQ